MKKVLLLTAILFLAVLPAVAEEGSGNGAENSVCIYGAMITSEYWAYPKNIGDSDIPIHFRLAPDPMLGMGFDIGWGINRSFDLQAGYNHFLRGSGITVVKDGNTYEGPDSVSFSPVYISLRYKSPFQLYFGAGLNYSVVGLTDNSISYADAGNFG